MKTDFKRIWVKSDDWGHINSHDDSWYHIAQKCSTFPTFNWTEKELEIIATCEPKDRLHLATDYSMVHRGFRKKCMWEHTNKPCLRDKYE